MNVNLIKSGATYATKRAAYYETLGNQLDKLYHDITADKLGEDAKTSNPQDYIRLHPHRTADCNCNHWGERSTQVEAICFKLVHRRLRCTI